METERANVSHGLRGESLSRAALLGRKRARNQGAAQSHEAGDISVEPPALSSRAIQSAAWVRRAGTLVLFVFVALGIAGVFGQREESVGAEAEGYALNVEYAAETRPGLKVPWTTQVQREGGFDGPVTLRVTGAYIEMFDSSDVTPTPASITSDGDYLLYEFEPPEGDRLNVSVDTRISPTARGLTPGKTVLVDGDREIVQVDYKTRVFP